MVEGTPPQRVSPPLFPERWDRPAKPGDEVLPAIADAFRQTGFQLGGDLRLLHEGMNLQVRVARDSYPSKYRTHAAAAGLQQWSRAFLAISDAAHAVSRASYSSVPPLVRAASEWLAAAQQASGEEQPLYQEWLRAALHPDERTKAVDVGMGQFVAGSTLAREPDLSLVYRAASELARPHFGAALLYSAADSNRQRVLVAFADQSFHAGLAQLSLGWLLTLCEVALRFAYAPGAPYAVEEASREAVEDWRRRLRPALEHDDRSRMEPLPDNPTRWVLHNMRRQLAGAPVRVLL